MNNRILRRHDRADDDHFIDYESKAFDPGFLLFIGTCMFCFINICLIPCVIIQRDSQRRSKIKRENDALERKAKGLPSSTSKSSKKSRRGKHKEPIDEEIAEEPVPVAQYVHDSSTSESSTQDDKSMASGQSSMSRISSAMSSISGYASSVFDANTRRRRRGHRPAKHWNTIRDLDTVPCDVVDATPRKHLQFKTTASERSVNSTPISLGGISELHPDEGGVSVSAYDVVQGSDEKNAEKKSQIELQIFYGSNALWRPHVVALGWDKLKEIAAPDVEFKKLLKLAGPYTFSDIMESLFENVVLAIVGNYLGTTELSAYAAVDILLGMSDDFIGGIVDATMLLVPHSIGAGNNYLAGQYIQICTILYLLVSIMAAACWWFFLVDIILWLPEIF